MGGHRKSKRAAPSQPSMFVRAIPPICLALALGGCAVGPDFLEPAAPVQDKWIESGDKRVAKSEVKSHWWRTLRIRRSIASSSAPTSKISRCGSSG